MVGGRDTAAASMWGAGIVGLHLPFAFWAPIRHDWLDKESSPQLLACSLIAAPYRRGSDSEVCRDFGERESVPVHENHNLSQGRGESSHRIGHFNVVVSGCGVGIE